MGKLRTLTRRTFLVGSVAVAGGVAFGAWLIRRTPDNPLLDGLQDDEAALTPYVKITPDGITLITPRADKGQGAWSMQAALLAEELDVELDQVTLSPGEPSAAYYNSALAGDSVPFAFYDQGPVANAVRSAAGAVMKVIGLQVTGGSTTVPDGYEKLRRAGAVARETLKQAAAERSGVDRSTLGTEAGHVILGDGSRIPYTELAAEAAAIEPVDEVALRPQSKWRLLGRPMQRSDIVAKSTGTQRYGIDLSVEGMVHATVITNPHIGGAMNGFDATGAEAIEGVQKIVPVTGGVGVIADNTWLAMKAAGMINFDWGEATIPHDMDAHWQSLSDSFTEARRDSRFRDDGDVALAQADVGDLIQSEYRAPYLAHAPMEPLCAIVRYTAERIDIWTGTQVPGFIRQAAAQSTGLEVEQVHVHDQMIGGSFGHRLENDYVQRTLELAMSVPGTPVKMTYSREQDMLHDYPRQIAMARGRGSVREGAIDSFDLDIAMPSLTRSQFGRQGLSVPGPDLVIAFGAFDQPYAIPHYRMSGYRAPDLAPISSWRSVGASTNVFFHESLFNELAEAAGVDPLEERLRLIDHAPSRDVLEAVAGMCDWQGPSPGEGRGRGVAFGAAFGVPVAEVVEVSTSEAGIRIERVWVAANVGQVLDPVNFENQVKGGVVFGLGHAMNCEITYANGRAQQSNYHTHAGMRMHQCPDIQVRGLETHPQVRGIGEPPVPPAAPALAAAIFAATGQRLREMPFDKHVVFA